MTYKILAYYTFLPNSFFDLLFRFRTRCCFFEAKQGVTSYKTSVAHGLLWEWGDALSRVKRLYQDARGWVG